MKKESRDLRSKTTSVIFMYGDGDILRAYLPNGKAVDTSEFERVILASTNYPESVCNRLADDIRDGEVPFPFYLNIFKRTGK